MLNRIIITTHRRQDLHLPLFNLTNRITQVRLSTSTIKRYHRRLRNNLHTFITTRMLQSKRPRQHNQRSLLTYRTVRRNQSTSETTMFPIRITLALLITSIRQRHTHIQTINRRNTRNRSVTSIGLLNSTRTLATMIIPAMIKLKHSLHVRNHQKHRISNMRHHLQP